MKISKRNIIPGLFAVLLGSCTAADDPRPGPTNGGIALQPAPPTVGVDRDATGTRAGDTPQALAEGSTVRIVAFTDATMSAAAYVGEGCYVMSGGVLTPCVANANGEMTSQGATTDGLWLRGNARYHFLAVTPALAVDHRQSPATVTVNNGTDFASSLTSGADGAGVAIGKGATTSSVTLNMLQRRCARLTFAFDRVWDNVSRVDIQSVHLTQLTNEPQTAQGAGDLPNNAPHTQSVTIGADHFVTNSATPYRASGAGIVLPKARAELDLTLNVCFNGNTTKPATLTAKGIAPIAFEKGLDYTFGVKLRNGMLLLTLEISEWTTVDFTGSIGSGPAGITPPGWDGSSWEGSTGSGPAGIVVGSWNCSNWEGFTGSGPSSVTPPTWQGSSWTGSTGSGPAGITPPGWNSSSTSNSEMGKE